MNIEQLRKKVLELAFNGKLTGDDISKWEKSTLGESINIIPSKKYQILQSQIRLIEKYPVISQSQDFIEGYSNNSKKLFRNKESVIVFGDHTRTVKYVDFTS
ncbi:MAG: hypothetical protein LBB07_00050 [Bifidobacteriaceae bacterium]|jgi:type I restriction enzyme S subunit|nr:hypothetical protein [Bifidobacteriaceae bacterium]